MNNRIVDKTIMWLCLGHFFIYLIFIVGTQSNHSARQDIPIQWVEFLERHIYLWIEGQRHYQTSRTSFEQRYLLVSYCFDCYSGAVEEAKHC